MSVFEHSAQFSLCSHGKIQNTKFRQEPFCCHYAQFVRGINTWRRSLPSFQTVCVLTKGNGTRPLLKFMM